MFCHERVIQNADRPLNPWLLYARIRMMINFLFSTGTPFGEVESNTKVVNRTVGRELMSPVALLKIHNYPYCQPGKLPDGQMDVLKLILCTTV